MPFGFQRLSDIAPQQMLPGVTYRFGVTKEIGSPDCQMGHVTIEPGVVLAPHMHPVSDAMFVLSGRGIFTLGAEEFPIEPGMFVVAPPDTRHGVRNSGDTPLMIIVTWPTGASVPRVPAPQAIE